MRFVLLLLTIGSIVIITPVQSETGHDFALNCDFCHTNIDNFEIDADSIHDLCFTCHDDFPKRFPNYGRIGGHPVSTHPTFLKSYEVQFFKIGPANLDRDKDFTCATCHDPHNLSRRPYLMRYEYNIRKGTCSGCHDSYY